LAGSLRGRTACHPRKPPILPNFAPVFQGDHRQSRESRLTRPDLILQISCNVVLLDCVSSKGSIFVVGPSRHPSQRNMDGMLLDRVEFALSYGLSEARGSLAAKLSLDWVTKMFNAALGQVPWTPVHDFALIRPLTPWSPTFLDSRVQVLPLYLFNQSLIIDLCVPIVGSPACHFIQTSCTYDDHPSSPCLQRSSPLLPLAL
jgi:hypothetical protein